MWRNFPNGRSCAKSGDWGWLAQELGYPAGFTILGCFAIGSIIIWLSFASVLKPACAGKRTGDSATVPVPAS
jgi:hypothetical protein